MRDAVEFRALFRRPASRKNAVVAFREKKRGGASESVGPSRNQNRLSCVRHLFRRECAHSTQEFTLKP